MSRAGGRRVVTPLFIVFITIGGTDILFALDSIPAVFGVTDQPYIVFVANAFALLGLLELYARAGRVPRRAPELADEAVAFVAPGRRPGGDAEEEGEPLSVNVEVAR